MSADKPQDRVWLEVQVTNALAEVCISDCACLVLEPKKVDAHALGWWESLHEVCDDLHSGVFKVESLFALHSLLPRVYQMQHNLIFGTQRCLSSTNVSVALLDSFMSIVPRGPLDHLHKFQSLLIESLLCLLLLRFQSSLHRNVFIPLFGKLDLHLLLNHLLSLRSWVLKPSLALACFERSLATLEASLLVLSFGKDLGLIRLNVSSFSLAQQCVLVLSGLALALTLLGELVTLLHVLIGQATRLSGQADSVEARKVECHLNLIIIHD